MVFFLLIFNQKISVLKICFFVSSSSSFLHFHSVENFNGPLFDPLLSHFCLLSSSSVCSFGSFYSTPTFELTSFFNYSKSFIDALRIQFAENNSVATFVLLYFPSWRKIFLVFFSFRAIFNSCSVEDVAIFVFFFFFPFQIFVSTTPFWRRVSFWTFFSHLL